MIFRIALALGLMGLVLATTNPARAEARIRLGILSCEAVQGTRLNLIFTSSVDVRCVFNSTSGVEYYKGETGIALGADLNMKTVEKIDFAVLSASAAYKVGSHSLSGRYLGAKVSASVGLGVGVAVLVGGGGGNFSLQPVALEGNVGFGAAAGLGFLYLEPDER